MKLEENRTVTDKDVEGSGRGPLKYYHCINCKETEEITKFSDNINIIHSHDYNGK
jgi:hypothetical protein